MLQDLSSTARLDSDFAIVLENSELRLLVRPDLGGRIDQLYDRRTERDWLWHSPDYDATQTRSLSVGDSFDDHWSGGWDEVFPNDAPDEFRGERRVDHGELWSQSWDVKERSALSVTLTLQCQTVPVLVEKTIVLHESEPQFTIRYRFENLSDREIPFLFKQHAAIAIEPGDEILLPECLIEPVVLDFSRMIGRAGKTKFPIALDAQGNEINLQKTRDRDSELREFFYSSDLAAGECGIRHARSQTELKMQFETTDFPYVWMFQSYGGWRDFYVLIAEPCTTMPYDLEVACQNGTVAMLQPHEVQQRNLVVSIDSSKTHNMS